MFSKTNFYTFKIHFKKSNSQVISTPSNIHSGILIPEFIITLQNNFGILKM